jgi:hypothetical protein
MPAPPRDGPPGEPLPPGVYPFWFWNAPLDEAEVRAQVAAMAEQGVQGFFVHPRQGLDVPYLGDRFLGLVRAAVQAAAEHGLIANLYDEYPYPSGVAGGEVLLGRPDLWATRLVHRRWDVPGGPVRLELPAGEVLAAVAWPLEGGRVRWDAPHDLRDGVGVVLADESLVAQGLTAYHRLRYFASGPRPVLEATLPPGPHRVHAVVQVVVEDHKYWGRFADVLHPEAVARFLACTHERYAAHLGPALGRTVRASFTDETAPGWSRRLLDAFRARYGEPLEPLLPALGEPEHPRHRELARALAELRYESFVEAFERPLRAWCHAHGLRYTGEKPATRLEQLGWSDLPGCDAGHAKAGRRPDVLGRTLRSNARAAASAAYLYGREGALCECYHSLGWAATLQDLRVLADALLVAGVTHLVPHAFFASTHGLRKHDAPPSLFWQMPWWPLFHHLPERVRRVAEAFRGTHLDAEVLVLDPSPALPRDAEAAAWERLLACLQGSQVEFLLADPAHLREAAWADGPSLRLRDLVLRAVLVPEPLPEDPEVAAWLAEAEARGLPAWVVGPGCDTADLARRLAACCRPALGVAVREGAREDLWATARTDGHGRRVWLLLNAGTAPLTVELTPRAGLGLREEPLDPALPPRLEREGAAWVRRLEPLEAVLLEGAPGEAAAPRRVRVVPLHLPEAVTVSIDRPNLLRLGRWALRVRGPEGAWDGPREVEPMPVVNQLASAGLRAPLEARPRFGLPPELRLPRLTLEYRAAFAWETADPVALVLEPGSVVGSWSGRVGDGPAFGPADLAPTPAHVRGSLAVDLTPWLAPGVNVLTLTVETNRSDGGLLAPPYLAGGFAVRPGDPPRLVPRAEAGRLEAYEDNGLPHFAGVVEYRGEVELPAELAAWWAEGPVLGELRWPAPCEDAVRLRLGDGPWQDVPWSPRLVRLDPAWARPGPNRFALAVHTTLSRAFQGERFDPVAHRYAPVWPDG